MKQPERHQIILDQVTNGNTVLIEDLVSATQASASTVRRDLRILEEAGHIVSLRGGAIRADTRSSELPAAMKSLINRDAKISIAKAAASIVREGDTIYVDSGTTATEFMLALRDFPLHVITSNTQVLSLALDQKISVTALGGDYLQEIGSIAGTITDRQLEELYFDMAFIGATGVDPVAGITTFDIREANKKRLADSHSRETYVLADSSKMGHVSLCRAFPLTQTTVITETPHPILDQAKNSILAT